MGDQEFSSPGEHMASRSSGPSSAVDVGKSTGRGPGESNIIYSPGALENINRGYKLHQDEVDTSSSRDVIERYNYNHQAGFSYKDLEKAIDLFNEKYFSKNAELFHSARDYDMMMSNTAIQRQVADLKAAGLNPILATRLGGASYNGVQPPYMSISPASALGNYLNYDSTVYGINKQADTSIETTLLNNQSQELRTQWQMANDLFMQGELFNHEEVMVDLKRKADAYLENLSHQNELALQSAGFHNSKQLEVYKNQLDKGFYLYKDYYKYDFYNEDKGDLWTAGKFLLDWIADIF